MAIDYVMPKLAMAMNEGTVDDWLVKHGDFVEKGAPLIVVETEKVAYDLESPVSGYLFVLVPTGETVAVESLIAKFAETEEEFAELKAMQSDGEEGSHARSGTDGCGEASAGPKAQNGAESSDKNLMQPSERKTGTSGERVIASPLAKKMASLHDLSIDRISGTGPRGRIVKRDVLKALATEDRNAPVDFADRGMIEKARIQIKGTARATIARRMMQSLQTTAQLSSVWEADITDLLRVRQSFLDRETLLDTRVSINAFLIKAIACAVRQVPIANSALVGDEIIIYENVNMGIAIALPGKTEYDSVLMVPVIKHVDRLGVVEIDKQMKALVSCAKEGKLKPDDMANSTITLSSTAGIAPPGMQTTPLLNLPNALLIGPSTPQEKPVVYQGEIVARTLMPVSMTFDHRVLDGEPAARFMKSLNDCLEHPELMLA